MTETNKSHEDRPECAQEGVRTTTIDLADYPNIRPLFWGAPGLRDVDEATLFCALDNNWKWIAWENLLPTEKKLIDRLAAERGAGWIGERHV